MARDAISRIYLLPMSLLDLGRKPPISESRSSPDCRAGERKTMLDLGRKPPARGWLYHIHRPVELSPCGWLSASPVLPESPSHIREAHFALRRLYGWSTATCRGLLLAGS